MNDLKCNLCVIHIKKKNDWGIQSNMLNMNIKCKITHFNIYSEACCITIFNIYNMYRYKLNHVCLYCFCLNKLKDNL